MAGMLLKQHAILFSFLGGGGSTFCFAEASLVGVLLLKLVVEFCIEEQTHDSYKCR